PARARSGRPHRARPRGRASGPDRRRLGPSGGRHRREARRRALARWRTPGVPLQPGIMPKLGVYMEDGLLSEWLGAQGGEGQPGGEVEAGQVLFVLESDKTEAEVEAEVEGWLHHTVEAGAKVAIGSEVGVVTTTREEYDALRSEQARAGDGGVETHPFL